MSPMVQIAQCHSAARYFRGQGVHCRVLIRRAPSGKIFHSVEKRNRSPDQHPRQIEFIIWSIFASSGSIAGLVSSMGRPTPSEESAVPDELVPGAAAVVPKAPPMDI